MPDLVPGDGVLGVVFGRPLVVGQGRVGIMQEGDGPPVTGGCGGLFAVSPALAGLRLFLFGEEDIGERSVAPRQGRLGCGASFPVRGIKVAQFLDGAREFLELRIPFLNRGIPGGNLFGIFGLLAIPLFGKDRGKFPRGGSGMEVDVAGLAGDSNAAIVLGIDGIAMDIAGLAGDGNPAIVLGPGSAMPFPPGDADADGGNDDQRDSPDGHHPVWCYWYVHIPGKIGPWTFDAGVALVPARIVLRSVRRPRLYLSLERLFR